MMDLIITRWKPIIVALVAFVLLALGNVVFAQGAEESDQDVVRKHGITFPIAELGNCGSIGACKSYCDDPVHAETCIAFAKQKGFYKQEEMDTRRAGLLEEARTSLGCDSEDTCRAACQDEANFEKCQAFAQKHGAGGANPKQDKMLQRAREVLGCDSPQACRAVCEDQANAEKCSQFAQENGLRGGTRRVGPGGCSSEETCRAFCSDPGNFDVCSKFVPPGGGQGGLGGQRGFKGPGGCNSPESCRSYCEGNPSECQKFGPGPGGQGGSRGEFQNPADREKAEKLCREKPEECLFKNQGGPGGFGGQGLNQEEIKKWGPGRQGGFGDSAEFEKRCREKPEKCRFQGPGGQGQFGGPPGDFKQGEFRPPEGSRPSEGFRPPEGFKPPEGSYPTPAQSQPSGSTSYPTPQQTAPTSGWTQPTEVKGVRSTKNPLQLFFDTLGRFFNR